MLRTRLLFIPALALGLATQVYGGSNESVYTSLSRPACKLLQVQMEGANSVQRCPGPAGFHLLVLDSDSRESVTVVSPEGNKSPLNFWHVVTRSFSSLGPKAEWRVAGSGRQARPVALIIRVNANEDPNSAKPNSYLVVSKITGGQVCAVSKIKSSAKANEEARAEADAAAEKPCLQPLD